jgi:hypothetical protein
MENINSEIQYKLVLDMAPVSDTFVPRFPIDRKDMEKPYDCLLDPLNNFHDMVDGPLRDEMELVIDVNKLIEDEEY